MSIQNVIHSARAIEDQKMLRSSIRKFAENELAPKADYWDERGEVPLENVKKAAELGLLGMRIPEQYGGQGESLINACIVWEEISRACTNTAMAVHVCDACSEMLLKGGTETQKRKYIPSLCKGDKLLAFSAAEPEAGTDLTALSSSAMLVGDEYIVNAQKAFTTLATVADAFLVLTRTKRGYSLFVIERDTPGLSVGALNKFVGARAIGNSIVYFDNCRISTDSLIGKDGEGLNIILEVLPPILLLDAMLAIGLARAAFDAAVKHVKERTMYGAPMAKLQGVRWKIAEMALEIERARQLTFHGVELFEQKSPTAAMIGSMAKWSSTEMSVTIAKEAMQLHGGYGITKDYPLQRYLRDALALTMSSFPTDYHKSLVADALLVASSHSSHNF